MSDTSSQIMALAAESHKQGALDGLASLRDAFEEAQAGPMWTPQILAFIDAAIDDLTQIDRHSPGEPQPQEAQQEHTE